MNDFFTFIRDTFMSGTEGSAGVHVQNIRPSNRMSEVEPIVGMDFINLLLDPNNRSNHGFGARILPNFDFGVLLHGNLNDYAIGQEGLDAVVTQLLNQFEGTGPPPMAKSDIDTLPDVKINSEQINSNLQCTVCMDDFILDEFVKQLVCKHVFHKDCIVPWLEMHGTCPICRKLLNKETLEDEFGNEQTQQNERTNSSQAETSQSTSSNPGSSGYRSTISTDQSVGENSNQPAHQQQQHGDHNYNSQRSFDYGFDELD